MADNLRAVESRVSRLQSQLAAMREELAGAQRQQATEEENLQARLGMLSRRLESLPDEVARLCPDPPDAATVNTRCEGGAEVQRVVVSGDKLVVGDVERVRLDPPGVTLVARIDAGSDHSMLHAADIVEFERDGSKWVRFDVVVDDRAPAEAGTEDAEEPGEANGDLTLEQAVVGTVRVGAGNNGPRRPAVELRIQLGDLREKVQVVLVTEPAGEHPMVLGRNFLTDVALVEVGRRYVQPSFQSSGD